VALLGVGAWYTPSFALRFARPALLNFGPNDEDYVRGFREGWERLGVTRFHWTTRLASVRLPLLVRGEGHVLRMRIRRHFVEPAHVRMITEGRTAGSSFDIKADPHSPYLTLELPLPPLRGGTPFLLMIEAPSDNPAPLGIAMDWMEIRRESRSAVFLPLASMRLSLLLVVAASYLALRASGGSRILSLAWAAVLLAGSGVGSAWDVIATERILREGAPVYVALASLTALLLRWPRLRRFLSLDPAVAGLILTAVMVAAAVRLVLLLHPQFYYPDVKVHALFARELARKGLEVFLSNFTANQFRYSLGLQFENGHWYAFPYPPGFYILCWPLIRWFGRRPEVAVSVVAAAINSLEVLTVYATAQALKLTRTVALAACLVVPILPLFLARLTLAYFPAMSGHAVDAVLICVLLVFIQDLHRPFVIGTLGGLLALATLVYTQTLLNFAVLLPIFLILRWALDRTPGLAARQRGLVLAGFIGVSLSFAVFYARYVPAVWDMQKGIPQVEEHVLLEKMERAARLEAEVEDAGPATPPDPYAGPDLDLLRGLRKAAWRLYVFYGAFAAAVLAGIVLLVRWALREGGRSQAAFLLAWGGTYLVLNLASGGLPGPNLVRYNKDLEIVAPLFCLALGFVGAWLWQRTRVLALTFGVAFWSFGIFRAVRSLTQTFVLER
jgi:hypothetical protein